MSDGGIATYEPTPVYRKAWATSGVTSSRREQLFLVNPSPTERETVRITFRDGEGSSCSASVALEPLGDGTLSIGAGLPCALATNHFGHIELEGQIGFSGLMLISDGAQGLAVRNFVELPAAAGSDGYQPLGLWRISDGSVGFYIFSSLQCVSVSNTTVAGVQYTIHSSKWQRRSAAGGAWADVPNSGHTGGVCASSPTEPGQYRGVAEISVAGERGMYATSNVLTIGGEDGSVGSGQPSFGSATVADSSFTAGTAISSVRLPAASGGDGTLAYSLTPTIPGLTFSASSRVLSGTPSRAGSYNMTYRVRDSGGEVASLTFTVTVAEAPAPDLTVSASVSDSSLSTGESFTLRATVRNRGDGPSARTTLRYYRSGNSRISSSDTRVGTDVVSALAASRTGAESISVSAPSSAGTYYYGACVDSVAGESDDDNNCSAGVRVTVSSSGGGGGSGGGGAGPQGACRAGLIVDPGGSCTYKGYTFRVSSSGRGQIAFFSAGTGIDARGSTINGVRWNFHATKNSGSSSWTIHVAN